MGNFLCSQCGGEYHLPLRTTYVCPNCNTNLISSETSAPVGPYDDATGYGSLGEPLVNLKFGECPHCHGIGKDDGGPGSWTCISCRGSGQVDEGWPHSRRTAVIMDDMPAYKWERRNREGDFEIWYTNQ